MSRSPLTHWMLVGLVTCFGGHTAYANLPPSDISTMKIPVYGIYWTDDPTCQTNLIAMKPITSQPTIEDFAQSPSLGTGPLPPNGVACVVFVVSGEWTLGWNPGTYTTQSHFGTSTFEDSNCNAGGSEHFPAQGEVFGCSPGNRSVDIDWPTQIQTDLTAAGLSFPTKCTDTDSARLFPMYLSTWSKCRGEVTEDTTIGGTCDWQLPSNLAVNPGEGYRSNTIWKAPTQADDANNGIRIDPLPSGTTRFKFKVEAGYALGGNSGHTCGGLGPPKFSFEALP